MNSLFTMKHLHKLNMKKYGAYKMDEILNKKESPESNKITRNRV